MPIAFIIMLFLTELIRKEAIITFITILFIIVFLVITAIISTIIVIISKMTIVTRIIGLLFL